MRTDFETPIDFASSKEIGEHQIIYKNLKEIAQGSPVIGQLSIDSEPIARGAFFGGPRSAKCSTFSRCVKRSLNALLKYIRYSHQLQMYRKTECHRKQSGIPYTSDTGKPL